MKSLAGFSSDSKKRSQIVASAAPKRWRKVNDRKRFLIFSDGTTLNVNRIRMIDQVDPSRSRCRIWFDREHKVELHGDAAIDLLRHIAQSGGIINPPPGVGGGVDSSASLK
jgi:hypothetical protein